MTNRVCKKEFSRMVQKNFPLAVKLEVSTRDLILSIEDSINVEIFTFYDIK